MAVAAQFAHAASSGHKLLASFQKKIKGFFI